MTLPWHEGRAAAWQGRAQPRIHARRRLLVTLFEGCRLRGNSALLVAWRLRGPRRSGGLSSRCSIAFTVT